MEYKEIVKEKEKKIRQISTSQFIIFGFMIAIVIGTVLLMLPVSSQGKSITNVVLQDWLCMIQLHIGVHLDRL